MQALGVLRVAVGVEALQFELGLRDHRRVEQLAQLGATEQFGEQRRIERQRGGAALGQRRVALVHEGGDVAEQQRAGERRRRLGLDLDQAHLARRDVGGQRGQGGKVVDVLQHLAHRLEDDREARVLARHLEQLRAALPLLPERRAAAGVVARQQQGARRRLAETRREQRRAADLEGDQLLRARPARTGTGRRPAARRRSRAAAPRSRRRPPSPSRRRRAARGCAPRPRAPTARAPGCRTGSAARAASRPARRGSAPPPASCRSERCPWPASARARTASGCRPPTGRARPRRSRSSSAASPAAQLAGERSDRLAELGGPPEPVALPERHAPRLPERGRDEHAIRGDLLDAPRGRPEREHVADPRLVDHLLVELADAAGAVRRCRR